MTTQTAVEFLREMRGASFLNWTNEALADYVLFHAEQRTIACVGNQRGLVAMLIGWGQNEPNQVPFTWQPHNPQGRFWWWDQYLARSPHAAMLVAALYAQAHPRSLDVPGLMMRHGRIKLYQPGQFGRVYTTARRIYGNQSQPARTA